MITTEEINLRIASCGIRLVSQYVSTRAPGEFTCDHGHTWKTTTNNVLNGHGCPYCNGKTPLTGEIINANLASRGIKIIGKFTTTKIKTMFECLHHHQWMALPKNVLYADKGCPECALQNRPKKSKEEMQERLNSRGIQIIGEVIDMATKTDFVCSHGHMWTTIPNGVVNNGSGCPTCAEYGFNPANPAWEYIFTRDGYLKFGITNDLTRRLNEHRRHGEIELVHKRHHGVGQLALDWENNIKRTLGGRYAAKEQCPDGYTETLPLALLEEITR